MTDTALFIHSTGMGPFMWTQLLESTPQGIARLTPANRGYSPTDLLARGARITLKDEVAHLKAQLPHGSTGVHLVAHSYGGLAALHLAMDPEVPVRSIWLYEPVMFGSLLAEMASLAGPVADEVRALFVDGDVLQNEAAAGSDAWLERFIDYWNQPGTWVAMSAKTQAMARLVGWKMYQEVRMVSQEAEAFGHYRLAVPMTVVYGERTRAPAAEMVRRLAQVNPHAHVTELSGHGHMAIVGAPDAVWPTLQAHWARVTQRA